VCRPSAFSDWGNILYNTTIATAIADRLVENSEIFLLGGDCLRMRIEDDGEPGNLAWACRRCNSLIGIAMKNVSDRRSGRRTLGRDE
jgi:IstB-like ATP binding protein